MKSKGMESEEIYGRILFTLDNFMKKVAHYSHMHSFYLDEADSFLEFLRSCNEKEILIKTVIKHLEGVNHKSPFIFTDI